ncbi:hypothetical protein SteCoe_10945 [Stentor coeruleus]|uniref:DUF676 domain-containing protein n=1 Tax=Stentor coeruleus TaxID=5963 RepID=A0A1R2CEH3_9CILI|nr:hypothetical protein SteCoe_10945 [Stentor coeruleus]
MSVKANIEIVLHIGSLRAIDLLHQGLYILQFQIHSLSNKEKTPAFPCNIFHPQDSISEQKLFPGKISQNSFKTSALYLKHFDETVDINEICTFHTEIEILPNHNKSDLYCTCELLYTPLFIKAEEDVIKIIEENTKLFMIKGRAEISIISPLSGISAFCPVFFRNENYFELHCCFYVFVTEFKYRSSNINEEIVGLVISSKKQAKKKINYEDAGKIMFSKQNEVSNKEFVEVYEKFVVNIQFAYEKIRELCLICTANSHFQELVNTMPDYSIQLAKFYKAQQIKPATESVLPKLEATEIIFSELFDISETLKCFLPTFINLLQTANQVFFKYLLSCFNTKINNLWNQNIVYKNRHVENYEDYYLSQIQCRHESLMLTHKACLFESFSTIPIVIQTNYFPEYYELPILLIDSLSKPKSFVYDKIESGWIKTIEKVEKTGHVVFLVHGFGGSAMDMRKIRSHLSVFNKNLTVVCAYSNEGKTNGDIQKMGKRLAKEVNIFASENFSNNKLNTISFIGYSLGGIIIRAALPLLDEFYDKFGFFITLSSPHLGTLANSSYLVDAGIWVLRKLKKTISMKQLSMKDGKDIFQTFLYQLSNSNGIEFFKNVAFVSSLQDKYAPFESTRVEVGAKAWKSSNGDVLGKMAVNMLRKIQSSTLIRIDANFKFKGASFDRAIGRAAHIEMIENANLIDMILNACKTFFE